MKQILAVLTAAVSDAGVDSAHAELAARTVVYYVLGFTVDEQSRLQWDAAGAELPEWQSVLTDDANARFGFGLRCSSTESTFRRPFTSRRLRGVDYGVVSVGTASVRGVITVDDVRRIASTLPRSYEAVVRDEIRFRAGRLVYAAFSRDETVMGVGFPKEERAAMVASRTRQVHAAARVRDALQLDSGGLDAIDLESFASS